MLNSGVTGFCFELNLRKCSDDLFFWSPRRKIGDLCKNLYLLFIILGPLLFLILILNDIGIGVSSTLRLFADDCLMYRVIDSTRDAELLQHYLHLITEWCKQWQKRLNLDNCVTLYYSADVNFT